MNNLFCSNCGNSLGGGKFCNGCGAADVSNPTPVSSAADPTRRRVGPPPVKHSSPDYNKITAYVHRNFLDPVRGRLFHQGLESSVLFERLLATWLIAKSPHEIKIG
jgi:hypothetical protein